MRKMLWPLLALKMLGEAAGQGMQAASGRQKGQGNGFPPKPPGRKTALKAP